MTLRIAIPDLISPSYFPAIAAVELGFLREGGQEATIDLHFPVEDLFKALREGEYDYVGASAHAALYAFTDWDGCRLVCALSQGMYWFLVVRSDLDVDPNDLRSLRGLRIGAAPGPADGLRQLLRAVAIDPDHDLTLGPVPASGDAGVSFGVAAAAALGEGSVDGFWANGMGAEVAVRRGVGKVILDARRGPRPDGIEDYTFAALVTTERRTHDLPDEVRYVRDAITRAQQALVRDPQLAREVALSHFPEAEAGLISDLIQRDAPFYDPAISDRSIQAMHRFASELGLTSAPPPEPDQLVFR